jgi:hypothetical protein
MNIQPLQFKDFKASSSTIGSDTEEEALNNLNKWLTEKQENEKVFALVNIETRMRPVKESTYSSSNDSGFVSFRVWYSSDFE